ncbi:hypothetical protein D779_3129 [Imhoffiella purpurea]|uniref:Uncharacterized protein n=1 Tax=Imhoffiella purpurea TaxID=1249627 RepID=W9V3N8_9GAMM|nr:hypothetical protein D779_3129 [Imhoffiella purpurea]
MEECPVGGWYRGMLGAAVHTGPMIRPLARIHCEPVLFRVAGSSDVGPDCDPRHEPMQDREIDRGRNGHAPI